MGAATGLTSDAWAQRGQMPSFEAPRIPPIQAPPAPLDLGGGSGIGNLKAFDNGIGGGSINGVDNGSGSMAGAGGGDSGGSGGDPSQVTRVYITIACAYAEDASTDCQDGVEQATDTLTEAMAEEAASDISKEMLSVHFSSVFDRAEQIKFLYDIENAAISAVQLKLSAQLSAVAPFQTQQLSPAEADQAIAQHETMLDQINQRARAQADSGENWSQGPQNTYTFRFQSHAYNQLRQISRSGWGGN
jgi:hypothetical protein